MPIWLVPIISFLGKRGIHFIVYAVFALIGVGLWQKFFPSNSSNIEKIEKQVNVYGADSQREPLFGCAAWRLQTEVYWKRNESRPPTE